MSNQRAYELEAFTSYRDKEINRLRQQLDLGWEKEQRNLSWFGLRDGMSVLDIGSGPGFLIEKLLSLLPNSPVTGVEIDPAMIEYSQQYLQAKAGDRLKIQQASITDMGLPDNSFDFALARYVFWTLPNPETAAREVRRILKPGGKLIITDFDQQIYYLLDPFHSKHELAIKKLEEKSTKLGGNNFVGRHLLRILKQAGFEELELEALTLHSDQFDVETLMKIGLDPDWMTQVVQFGLLKEELQEIRLATEQFLASGDSIAMFTYLMACGKKPLKAEMTKT